MSHTAQDFITTGIESCKKEEFKAGVQSFDSALKLEPNNAEALYNRAKAYFKTQDFDRSIQDFSQLIVLYPTNAFYFSERGVAYHLKGDSELALKDLDKAAELEPNKPFRYSSRAFIKDRMGDLKGAIADYEKTIELDPEDAIAYNNKGLVEEKLGYKERSKKSFDKADALDPKKPKGKSVSINPQAAKSAEETTIKNIKSTADKDLETVEGKTETSETTSQKETVTIKQYLYQLKSVLVDKEERSAFGSFMKQLFSKKN